MKLDFQGTRNGSMSDLLLLRVSSWIFSIMPMPYFLAFLKKCSFLPKFASMSKFITFLLCIGRLRLSFLTFGEKAKSVYVLGVKIPIG